jgi:hypothetical protein
MKFSCCSQSLRFGREWDIGTCYETDIEMRRAKFACNVFFATLPIDSYATQQQIAITWFVWNKNFL